MIDYSSIYRTERDTEEFFDLFPYPTRNSQWSIDVETGERRVTFEFLNDFGDWIQADRSLDE